MRKFAVAVVCCLIPASLVFKDGMSYDSAKLIESVRGAVGSR